MDDNNRVYHMLGQVQASLETLSNTVSTLANTVREGSRESEALRAEFSSVKHGLKHTNDDIRQLRDTVVTPEKLRRAGLDLDDHVEHRKDFAHLREVRLAAEERRPVYRTVVGAVAGAAMIAAGAWAWSAMTDRAAADLHTRIEVKK